ncbi:MAG: uracil-DNA glycosylase [Patescibacteria group bacterium]
MDKQQLLDQVAQEIIKTNGGPFGPGLNAVPGEGNPDAETLWVGEAPGATENQLGRPFVGVSGKLLRKTMEENGFKPEEVFITNIVKFRPPDNRDPLPAEIEFFKPFLDKQIEIINPKIIVTVGRFSMYKFFGEGISIGKIHGQPRKIGNYFIFPMFHPAAALRAGDMMKMFVEDFKKLREFVDSLNNPKPAEPKVTPVKQMELI